MKINLSDDEKKQVADRVRVICRVHENPSVDPLRLQLALRLWFTYTSHDGTVRVGQPSEPLIITTYASSEGNPPPYAEPLVLLNHEEATDLMDSLWSIGIRPSAQMRGGDTPSDFAALRAHLEDMRTLVFQKEAG